MSPQPPPDREPEPLYHGGADAVPDSPGAVEHGAEPNQESGPHDGDQPTAQVASRGGLPASFWIVLAALALAALLYGLGLFGR